jgi:NNP family nitrate/nitrite transporter-like MFS transporter
MKFSEFRKAGHLPTLLAAFLYFDVSFMVWILLGPLGPFIGEAYKLSATQKGLMVALPLLAGSFFRPILGILADRFGCRRTGLLGLALTLIPLVLGWKLAHSLTSFYAIGILLGIAGASFAVALPLAGRWYPPEYQGLAMGIAGAGNSGTLFATLFAPRLAQTFGWHAVFGLAMIPIAFVLLLFFSMAEDSPSRIVPLGWKDYAAIFREIDTVWFSFIYSLTFGGFVGLASFLTVFFHDQYHLSKVQAGDFTTVVVIAGSFLRPVGGFLSDKVGGYRLLLVLLAGVGLCLAGVGFSNTLAVAFPLLVIATGMLGMGNGAVFQLVPQRFSKHLGTITGVVGAAGGLGGFFLPSALGIIKDRTGQYSYGLLLCAAVFGVAELVLLQLGNRWQKSWHEEAVRRSGVFSSREAFRRPIEAGTD